MKYTPADSMTYDTSVVRRDNDKPVGHFTLADLNLYNKSRLHGKSMSP